jgi:beta-galactosidase
MRLWSYQAMAHGADTVMYFQWRRGRGATEKMHGAVVEHEGSSRPRVFQEVAALGRELEALGTRTIGGRVPARVAILFDWDNWWAVEYSSGPSVDLKYVDQCLAHYRALHTLGIPTDVVSPDANLDGYDLVVAPFCTWSSRRRRKTGSLYPARRHVRHNLLFRHRGRERPRASRRLSGAAPQPARSLGRGD